MPHPEFPHMMPEDIPVWSRWLTLQSRNWDHIDYDVHVGEGVTIPDDWPDNYKANALGLSLKRIDAVIFYGDRICIVEVKKIAGWKALGQIVGYPVLYSNYMAPTMPVTRLLICEGFDLDLQNIMDQLEIPYEIVPPAPTVPDTFVLSTP